MRNFSFAKTDQPSMVEFNKRFDGIAEFINNLGNEYVWAKNASRLIPQKTEWTQTNMAVIATKSASQVATVQYSDTIELVDGEVRLVNPSALDLSYDTYDKVTTLVGKYFIPESTAADVWNYGTAVYYCESARTPDRGTADGYYYAQILDGKFYKMTTKEVFDVVGYVNSSDPNAYPVDDGYTYIFRGKVGAAAQFAHGSYMGTGTYGEGTPNSLTFGFVPALVWIYRSFSLGGTGYNQSEQYNLTFTPSLSGEFVQIYSGKNYDRYRYNYDPNASTPTTALASVNWENGNKTVKWWAHSSAGYQLNQSDTEYYYLAIG